MTADLAIQQGLSTEQGAYVSATTTDGPAAAAGITEGDVIVAVDGRTVRTPEDLGSILDTIRPNTTVDVEIVGSSGERRTIQVTVAERPLPVDIP